MKAQAESKRRIPGANLVQGVIGELRKVAWPSRQEAIRLTGIVLVVTGIASLILWGIDTIFTELVELILLD
ncbi:MAG: preprotein translocase subunit SecE [Dehalococcoidia bacterium]